MPSALKRQYFRLREYPKRATVVVDKAGKVVWIKEQPITDARDNKELLEAIRKAQ
jgi:peroxiredoxin